LNNRGKDILDIVTLEAGGGAGGKIRLGPLQTGLLIICFK
jgi:hypothetical protein